MFNKKAEQLNCRAIEGRADVLRLIGKLPEARREYRNLLNTYDDPLIFIRSQLGIGRVQLNMGHLHEALQCSEKALKTAMIHKINQEYIHGLILKAHIQVRMGDFPRALKTAMRSHDLVKKEVDRKLSVKQNSQLNLLQARVISLIAMVYCMMSDYDRAIPILKDTIEQFKKHQDVWNVAVVQQNLGNAYNEIGNYSKAFDCYDASLAIKQKIGDKYGIANTLHNISRALNMDGRYQEALERSQHALKISKEIHDISGIGLNHLAIGVHYRCMGYYKKALSAYQASLRIYQSYPEPYIEIANLSNIANVLLLMGQYAKCRRTIEKAEPAARKLQNPYLLVNVLNVKAQFYLEKRNYTESRSSCKECIQICRLCGLANEEIQALSIRVQIVCREGSMTKKKSSSIASLLQRAFSLHRSAPSIEALSYLLPAQIESDLAIEDYSSGTKHAKEYLALVQRIENKSLLPEVYMLQAKIMSATGQDPKQTLRHARKLAQQVGRKPLLREIQCFHNHQNR